jgi:hypothetical protein
MKVEILVKKEVDIKYLQVKAEPIYWEDASVNGVDEDDENPKIPCKVGDLWMPKIDIDKGQIVNWEKGTIATTHYKVCDMCGFDFIDSDNNIIEELSERDGYVPNTLCPNKEGYGEYIKMDIDEGGFIKNWIFYIEDFVDNDND